MRLTPMTLLLILAVAFGGWWFFLKGDGGPDGPEHHAEDDIETSDPDATVSAFRKAWNEGDVNTVEGMTWVDPIPDDDETADDEELSDAATFFRDRMDENGWLDEPPPAITGTQLDRTANVRFKLTCVLQGLNQPLIAHWEWQDDTWKVVTWQIPLLD